ncbi:MAG: hypothetical protein ACYC63_14915 [Armatimonadota bacterium]
MIIAARVVGQRLRQWAGSRIILLATIPFWLISNSSQVSMDLKIERDGGALRQIVATVHPELRRDLPAWVGKVQAGRPWDMVWQQSGTNSYTYMRDFRTQNANYGDQGKLTIVDVFQNPFSIFTTYTWTEKVNFAYLYETDPLSAAAASMELKYKVDMPGTVTDASVQPSKGSSVNTEDDSATFTISASEPTATITVTSSRLRWGYILIVVYVLGWIALEVFQVVGRHLRRRPRKI